MKKVSAVKGIKQAHTSRSKQGSGDYYGTGVTAKIGRIRDTYDVTAIPAKDMGKPPKSMA